MDSKRQPHMLRDERSTGGHAEAIESGTKAPLRATTTATLKLWGGGQKHFLKKFHVTLQQN